MSKKQVKLPRLPYGQGSMSLRPDGTIMYRKRIGNPKKEKTIYADTPSEAMRLMSEAEKQLSEEIFQKETQTLSEAMYEWLETYKKPTLKRTSYDTLEKTVRSRISDYNIGNIRLDAIDSDLIQKHINSLNEKEGYSYSTIKKCYDALNDFYRNRYLRKKISYNPMDTVVMINKENIHKETKDIEFFEKDDIEKFINQATTILSWSGKPQYQYGFCLAANIFMGMRAGELIALKWEDIDFENNTVYIHNNLQLVKNPKYDDNNINEMKLRKIPKQIYVTQSLKNYQNRHIHLNKKAKELLLQHKSYSEYTMPNDCVCCTRDGRHSAINYLSNNIAEIEKTANMVVREKGTHVIRHTCASLYFRAGVRIELIASLLGHSVDVCRKTYIHFVEEQKKEAVKLINDYDNIDL